MKDHLRQVFAVAILVLAGCGSDSSNSESSKPDDCGSSRKACCTTNPACVGDLICHASQCVYSYSISGTVSGAVQQGVAVAAVSGASTGSATTDADGKFSVTGLIASQLAAGAYTVTPSLIGYTFSPSSRSVTIDTANFAGINFVASTAATCNNGNDECSTGYPSVPCCPNTMPCVVPDPNDSTPLCAQRDFPGTILACCAVP